MPVNCIFYCLHSPRVPVKNDAMNPSHSSCAFDRCVCVCVCIPLVHSTHIYTYLARALSAIMSHPRQHADPLASWRASLELCAVCVCVILKSSSLRFRLDLRPRLIAVTALDSHKPEPDAAPPAAPATFVFLTPPPECLVSLSRFKSKPRP